MGKNGTLPNCEHQHLSTNQSHETEIEGGRVGRRGRSAVTKMAHDVYDDMFAIIVRPNKNMKHLNEEFVVKDLCKGNNSQYLKVYAEDFFGGMKDARRSISKVINNY